MTTYDTIGKSYAITRKPDIRIVHALIEYLEIKPPALLADIGAGTGNYTRVIAEQGYSFIAVEPSKTMQSQTKSHKSISWRAGYAEQLPLQNNEVQGIISTLALHHFSNLELAFQEMNRVCQSGPIVLFTCDPRIAEGFWLLDYFPSFFEKACKVFPQTDQITNLLSEYTKRFVSVHPFPLPADLSDGFLASIWKTPETVLNPFYRAGVSQFAMEQPDIIQSGVEKLKDDLATGEWLRKYGSILEYSIYDAGYRFLVAKKHMSSL